MVKGNEDRAVGMSSLTDEEPLLVMQACIDIVWEVIREDGGDSRGSVVRKGEAPLGCCRRGSICKRSFGTEYRNVSRDWGSGAHRGLKVFLSRRGNENVVGVHGNVFVEWGKKEGVEDFLGDLG